MLMKDYCSKQLVVHAVNFLGGATLSNLNLVPS